MPIPNAGEVTTAVLAALEATGVVVGDAAPPDGYGWSTVAGQSTFTPHMILYPLTGRLDGMLAGAWDDGEFMYQVTCVGETREQCQWVVDKATGALVGQALDVETILVTLDDMAGVVRDDTVQPPVFMAPPRFKVWTTPS